MITGLIWAALFIVGILVGKFLIPTKKEKEKVEKLSVTPSELVNVMRMLFTYPMDEFDKKRKNLESTMSSLFGPEWDNISETMLEEMKENMLAAMRESREGESLANKFPRNPDEQIKDPGPVEITPAEEQIVKNRGGHNYINVA